MKTATIFLVCISISAASFAFSFWLTRPAIETQILTVDKDIVDLGEIKTTSAAKATFMLTNKCSHEIAITKIETSCGCASATSEKNLLGPDEASVVTLVMSTTGVRGHKSVDAIVKYSVRGRPGSSHTLPLRLKAQITPSLNVDPPIVSFSRNRNARAKVELKSTEKDVIVTEATAKYAGIVVSLQHSTLPTFLEITYLAGKWKASRDMDGTEVVIKTSSAVESIVSIPVQFYSEPEETPSR